IYAWSAPMHAEMNQTMAATFAPSAVTEYARPTRRNPGLARPMTNPSYHLIVFSRRRSSTATSAMEDLLSGLWSPAEEDGKRNDSRERPGRSQCSGGIHPHLCSIQHERSPDGSLRMRTHLRDTPRRAGHLRLRARVRHLADRLRHLSRPPADGQPAAALRAAGDRTGDGHRGDQLPVLRDQGPGAVGAFAGAVLVADGAAAVSARPGGAAPGRPGRPARRGRILVSSPAVVRNPTAAGTGEGTTGKPVMLLTFNVPFAPEAVQFAIDAACDAGSEL